jgi:type IV pilus assembly protein PilA
MNTLMTSRMAMAVLTARRNRIETKTIRTQGFTLVELMVVVVIVGILSATALPQFLGLKDKAKANTQIGEASGLAKECSAAILTEGPYPANYTFPGRRTNTGLTVPINCNGGNSMVAPRTSVYYITEPVTQNAQGLKCGTNTLTTNRRCRIDVNPANGSITYRLS